MHDPTAWWSSYRLDADVVGGSYVGHLKPVSCRESRDERSAFSIFLSTRIFRHTLIVSGILPAKCDGHIRVYIVYVRSVGKYR